MSQPFDNAKKEKLKTIDWLADHFPAAFFKKSNQVRPLKIGIFDDIVDFYERLETPPFSKKTLREALNYYSASPAYLSSQKANVARVDLYGNEVDIVTEDQAKYAYQRYQQRYVDKKKMKSSPAKNLEEVNK
ncbi:ProQ-like, activator of ProP osmoprotectant transporter (plasmid) [Legionella adelaidensis]|uniref:ProQ-like, activator of ProP osmoprotectant transporter n=2 Tax=Legionella adelaidensis TaxID=45056 RepID=A0A0W0R4J7_9GAMM|nr:ProQ/FinO family protein [Legionella adelaidensis]KTC65959.1 ProQ-like, activator of ProP osmoprotectant transporter [Legionella adelaidensis]VEH86283.1 ProQ-like, activator of ProP osmoprotectant transporter [Legionella adelaidensis]